MKRLFTFAIIATMIASFTFAANPATKKVASSHKIEKAIDMNSMQKKANEAKAIQAVQAEKAAAQPSASTSVFRKAGKKGAFGNQMVEKSVGLKSKVKAPKNCKFGPRRAETQVDNVTITTDNTGMIIDVTGVEAKYYQRSVDGTAYYESNDEIVVGKQSGVVTVIEDGDNVYVKNPITRFTEGSWIKGVKADGKITFACGQVVGFDDYYNDTLSLFWGKVTPEGKISKEASKGDSFSFAVNGDTWTLEGTQAFSFEATEDCYFIGIFYDDDDYFTGYGDAETVLTLNSDYVAPSTELVELPEGAEVLDWYLNGSQMSSSSETPIKNRSVKVAFVGDDVYLSNVFGNDAIKNSWIKGTISGTNIEFDNFQYLGPYGSYDIWAIGFDLSTEEIVAPAALYDADQQNISFSTELLANAAADRVYYLEWLNGVVLTAEPKEYIEPAITDLTADVPYHNTFETDDELEQAAIYDANDDGSTWTFVDDKGKGAARYRYNSSNPANDYLVFPGLALEADKTYRVSVTARAESSYYPEKFEVVAGKEAKESQLNIVVIPETTLESSEYETFRNGAFTVEESGTYYFAIHATSEANMYYMYISDFEVVVNDPSAPKPVDDLVITADPNGELKATVEFTVPSKTLNDEDITTDLNVVVKRGGEQILSETKAPGTKVELEDVVPEIGTYKYEVAVSYDGHIADSAALSAYIGEDTPDAPANIKVADHSTNIDVTWDPVTEGENGGIIIPENLTYNVYPVVMEEFWGMLFPVADTEHPYYTGLTDTQANVEMDTNEGEMGWGYIAIAAENAAGVGYDALGAFVKGTPYNLPVEVVVTPEEINTWLSADSNEGNENGRVDIAENNSVALINDSEGWIALEMGKVALNGATNPVVDFDLSTEGTGASLEVIAVTAEGETVLATLTPNAEVARESISLLAYKDADWVRIVFKGLFTADAEESIFIGNIKLFNKLDKNLVATISAPAKVKAGENVLVNVTVKNEGSFAVAENDYSVELYCNEELFDTLEGSELAAGARADYEFEVPTNAATVDQLTFKGVVVFEADQDQSNNTTKEATTVVAKSSYPAPTDLEGAVEDNKVVLTWTAPNLEGGSVEPITEDFEDGDGFSEEFGDWTFLCEDGGTVGTLEDGLPNIVGGETQGAFWVWDTEMVPEDYSTFLVPHSGNKCLFALWHMNEVQQSDWAISPELAGDAQTISFYALSASTYFGNEKVAVYYSTGSKETKDFVQVMPRTDVPGEWTEFTADLPAGAKYFAIVCESCDSYCMMVDDVTFTPADAVADLVLNGYKVYRDGEQIAATNLLTYTDENVEAGKTYAYAVSADYEQGESAVSNVISVSVEESAVDGLNAGKLGIVANKNIVITNAQGLDITVAAANGAVVYSNKGGVKTTVNVAPGVYVVKAGKTVKKVVVK